MERFLSQSAQDFIEDVRHKTGSGAETQIPEPISSGLH